MQWIEANHQGSIAANWLLIQLNKIACNTIAMAYSVFTLFCFTQIIFTLFIPNISKYIVDYNLKSGF
jgi:hypothetical protein